MGEAGGCELQRGVYLARMWCLCRERFLAKRRDPDCAADAVIGSDRAGRFSKRDRWSSRGVPPGSERGAFVGSGVRVPEPASDGVEDPGI